MFTLIHGGALPRQAAVFEEDLVRLVAGQDVSLDFRDSTVRRAAPLAVEEVVQLRGRFARPGTALRLVRGMFLSIELMEDACVATPQAAPAACFNLLRERIAPGCALDSPARPSLAASFYMP